LSAHVILSKSLPSNVKQKEPSIGHDAVAFLEAD